MRKIAVLLYGVAHGHLVKNETPAAERRVPLCVDGVPWVATVTSAGEGGMPKVFTHLFVPGMEAPITKGVGGFDTHHRGVFLGWWRTDARGKRCDSWHIKKCGQYCVGHEDAGNCFEVEWRDDAGRAFLRETRTLACRAGRDGVRMLDVETRLCAVEDTVRLRGDSHHAGVQIRLANEVCRHPWSTRFTLPDGARALGDDTFSKASWACCHATVAGRRVSVLHLTGPAHPPLEEAVYGTRGYGLFGASFPAEVTPAAALTLRFRVVWREGGLDAAACASYFEEYAASRSGKESACE